MYDWMQIAPITNTLQIAGGIAASGPSHTRRYLPSNFPMVRSFLELDDFSSKHHPAL
jgi:hypothetical protein